MASKIGTKKPISLLATTMYNTRGIMFASSHRISMHTMLGPLSKLANFAKRRRGGEREGQTSNDDCPSRFRRKVIVGVLSERGNAGMIVPPLAFGGNGK